MNTEQLISCYWSSCRCHVDFLKGDADQPQGLPLLWPPKKEHATPPQFYLVMHSEKTRPIGLVTPMSLAKGIELPQYYAVTRENKYNKHEQVRKIILSERNQLQE